MDIKSPVRQKNYAQTLITILLLSVLLGILALYIYYGMYQARQIESVAETVPQVEVSNVNDSDAARQQEIIEALRRQPVVPNEAKTQEIIKKLEQTYSENDTAESEQKRAEIIKALQQNQ